MKYGEQFEPRERRRIIAQGGAEGGLLARDTSIAPLGLSLKNGYPLRVPPEGSTLGYHPAALRASQTDQQPWQKAAG